MAKGIKLPKPKTCRICKTQYTPRSTLQKVCSPSCAIKLVKRNSELQHKQSEASARREWNKRKADIKPLRHWEDLTQRVVNDYITKGRDVSEPCISCGTCETVQWEAGHFRSRGAASHLRYNEDNIHKQCHRCNDELSSNAVEYRIHLVLKIGLERVLALENDNSPHRYTREELDGIRKRYRAKLRELKKLSEAA